MSVFKDFPGLENLEKKFKDFQGPARALILVLIIKLTVSKHNYFSFQCKSIHPFDRTLLTLTNTDRALLLMAGQWASDQYKSC